MYLRIITIRYLPTAEKKKKNVRTYVYGDRGTSWFMMPSTLPKNVTLQARSSIDQDYMYSSGTQVHTRSKKKRDRASAHSSTDIIVQLRWAI